LVRASRVFPGVSGPRLHHRLHQAAPPPSPPLILDASHWQICASNIPERSPHVPGRSLREARFPLLWMHCLLPVGQPGVMVRLSPRFSCHRVAGGECHRALEEFVGSSQKPLICRGRPGRSRTRYELGGDFSR
jgi:hypothetical protein